MRRDWKAISSILDVVEQLAGHPNLKELRDEANEDLKDLLAKPKQNPTIAELDEILNSNDGRDITINPDGTVAVSEEPKISRRSL